jgi:hypothetical protein
LNTAQTPATVTPVQIHADHDSAKRLGTWTSARVFQVRARRGQWDLAWTGRGKVKQACHHNPAGAGRRIRLTGQARHSEVRVHSGGIARLSAMCSREYLADARRAHAEGGVPTLDDPARSA